MHHANLLIGSRDWALSVIPEHEKVVGSDVRIFEFDRMSISDVRNLIAESNLRPVERSYRTFIILSTNILHEAQNALLKLFEEPNSHTLFYLVLPREDILLPTLRSRLYIQGTESLKKDSVAFLEEFIQASYSSRLSLITNKLATDDSMWVDTILKEYALYAHNSKDAPKMREIMLIESFSHSSGSSKKMLLEHLALSL